MKADIHPKCYESEIKCTCGKAYTTLSTIKTMSIGICADCHPFFTGEQKYVDTAGRVDRFAKRYGSLQTRRLKLKPKSAENK